MNAVPMAVPMAGEVNLKGGWDRVWQAVQDGFPGLPQLMTIIGVILVVAALLKWAWDRRRGGGMGQGSAPLWGALIPGAILCAPGILFPLLLGLLDWVANICIQLAKTATGS